MPVTSYMHHGYRQDRVKCGEWRFSKLSKWRREWNKKTKKGASEPKGQDIMLEPEVYKDYIEILLRHFALRYIYKDVINFIFGVTRTCFNSWEDTNLFEVNPKN